MGPAFALVVFTTVFSGVTAVGTGVTFTNSAYLDEAMNVFLQWRRDESTVTMQLEVQTRGMVAVGFSPNGNMPGSDIFAGYVGDDGQPYFHDYYAEAQEHPVYDGDSSQNYYDVLATENDTHTIVCFTRRIVLCDSNDRKIYNGTNRVIWAYHADDPTSERSLIYHGATNRGSRSLHILYPRTEPALPDDVQTIELLNQNYTVPDSSSTTYLCRGFKVPDLGGKRHLIRWEPVIQSGNEGVVHHFVLYQCGPGVPDPDTHDGTEYICYSNMPGEWYQCSITLLAWAIGGTVFNLPDNAGISMGDTNDPTFLMMETHYDNPDLRNDIVDSSGLRLYLTSTLRTNEVGVLQVGVEVGQSQKIPPGSASHTTVAHCYSECLQQGMEDVSATSLNVLAAFGHAHLAGRSVSVRHVRGANERQELFKDEFYDFNYQETVPMEQATQILPGDSILMECTYDTTDRSDVTYGGLATQNEMCIAWLLYYPKMELSRCESWPMSYWYLYSLGATATVFSDTRADFIATAPDNLVNLTADEIIPHVTWTDEIRAAFQQGETQAQRFEQCVDKNNNVVHGNRTRPVPPVIEFPWVAADECSGVDAVTADTIANVLLLAVGYVIIAFV
ncbi:MOXD1 [Branchiostoma lanceolatum]|uniref:MOXD1 protein n=1 Tax=Branchiostoma lanceolatum TaxID=7740 RepID=A0A8K0A921_BRALA|nr:MOXD1 [Branchiostoma lanceolatum]